MLGTLVSHTGFAVVANNFNSSSLVKHSFNPTSGEKYKMGGSRRSGSQSVFWRGLQSSVMLRIEVRNLRWLGCFAFLISNLKPNICPWILFYLWYSWCPIFGVQIYLKKSCLPLALQSPTWCYMQIESLPLNARFFFLLSWWPFPDPPSQPATTPGSYL